MHFSVDGWAPGYGSSLQEVEDLPESVQRLDPGVEIPPASWRPLPPSGVTGPPTVLFVDGVRRVEARLWMTSGTEVEASPGLCASYAAGVVRSTAEAATVVLADVRRAVLTTAEEADDITTRLGTWTMVHARPDPAKQVFDVLSLALQQRLAELEIVCAAEARAASGGDPDDLLVIDGPLGGRTKVPRAIGVIKSHQSTYLPADLHGVVGRLGAGERTPVFRLETTWERFSWYLRLPGSGGSPWAGVVRVECSPDLSPREASAMASLSQAVLPRYASEPFKDPRAPQNLYPISGLEKLLRHRLGDPQLLRRSLLQPSSR
ncbi:MAG TPA: hypothetical protein PLK46_09425 [Propioniciclava sp.]|jgi:hypothetical protein|uniref:hypothetical protein n=1 Tax=Propioniciclava sp. TaxID=2038686 RepID=UPI002BBD0E6B|nr:hypothetical protein [Propioniciclava sp.]HRL48627.1 hypothetical protein [Propioniciclava sp.]HRL80535.1 hypothetical protein [Propioniciclava sp.]